MERWLTIAGLATIIIALAALTILIGDRGGATTGDLEQEPTQVEELAPEEPTPAEELAPEEPTVPEEEPAPEEEPIPEEEPAPEEPAGVTEPGAAPQDELPAQDGATPQDLPGPARGIATIQIGGDAAYQCSVGRLGSPRTIRGQPPETYEVRVVPGGTSLDTVMAVCQKIEDGTLSARLIYGGEVKAQSSSDSRFGTVDVSWSPLEERGS